MGSVEDHGVVVNLQKETKRDSSVGHNVEHRWGMRETVLGSWTKIWSMEHYTVTWGSIVGHGAERQH